MKSEIKLYKSSWKGAKMIALSLPFVMIGFWMLSTEPNGTFNYVMGWICVCFFGLGIPLGLFSLFDKRVQIIITENGIWERTLKQGEIMWEHILTTYPIDIAGQKFVSIVVDESVSASSKTHRVAQKLNEFVGAQNVNLNTSQTKIDADELSKLLNTIANSQKSERINHIRVFSSQQKLAPIPDFRKYLTYLFILVAMTSVSISGHIGFMIVIVLTGLSALVARWNGSATHKSNFYGYARTITFLGFIHLVVLLLIFKGSDLISEFLALFAKNG